MNPTYIRKSIAGINRLIAQKQTNLRVMKHHALHPPHFSWMNWKRFYECGIKVMNDLRRLQAIKADLESLIYNSDKKAA